MVERRIISSLLGPELPGKLKFMISFNPIDSGSRIYIKKDLTESKTGTESI